MASSQKPSKPDQKATTNLIANFKQVIKDGDLRLHPLVTRIVDAETLEKMGAQQTRNPQEGNAD